MEVPGELKSDLQRILLGPLSLASDLYGALIPGGVFLILVSVKRQWITAILSYPLLGYKTKVAIALLASYIAGKVIVSVISFAQRLAGWVMKRFAKKGPAKPQPEIQNQLQYVFTVLSKALANSRGLRTFFVGLLGGSLLSNQFQIFDHYTAQEAGASFHLSTGLALVVCSLIPGDGHFRVVEAAAGVILLFQGIIETSETDMILASSYGLSLNSYLTSLKPEQLSAGLKVALQIIINLSKTPAGATPAASDAPSQPPTPAVETPVDTPADGLRK
jgi:hypothetical protein